MNSARNIAVTAVAAIVFLSLAGCKKSPKGLTMIPGDQTALAGDLTPTGPLSGSELSSGIGEGGTLSSNDFPIGSDVSPGVGQGASMAGLPDRSQTEGTVEDRETLSQDTVYFEFDRYSIRAGELPKVEAVGQYLTSQAPKALLKVEGHCDERGTEEYNRALGERRALAVRELLINLGVDPNRVTTESWGEDRPAVEGTTEEAYAKNRRAEFVILTR